MQKALPLPGRAILTDKTECQRGTYSAGEQDIIFNVIDILIDFVFLWQHGRQRFRSG